MRLVLRSRKGRFKGLGFSSRMSLRFSDRRAIAMLAAQLMAQSLGSEEGEVKLLRRVCCHTIQAHAERDVCFNFGVSKSETLGY